MFKKLLGASLLLSASLSVAMDQAPQRPMVALGSITSQMFYAEEGGHVRCTINTTVITIPQGTQRKMENIKLFALKADETITFSPRNPSSSEYYDPRTLKLELQEAALKIVGTLKAGQNGLEETLPLEAGKKYLLNVVCCPVGGLGAVGVETKLVEDND
jgi:hypothetical protein